MLEKHDKALEFTQCEMDINVNLHGEHDVSVAFCLQRTGAIFYGIGNMERALDSLDKARQILKQVAPGKMTLAQKDLL